MVLHTNNNICILIVLSRTRRTRNRNTYIPMYLSKFTKLHSYWSLTFQSMVMGTVTVLKYGWMVDGGGAGGGGAGYHPMSFWTRPLLLCFFLHYWLVGLFPSNYKCIRCCNFVIINHLNV